jgi:hypothetical protein
VGYTIGELLNTVYPRKIKNQKSKKLEKKNPIMVELHINIAIVTILRHNFNNS